jgi:hypothetical protein
MRSKDPLGTEDLERTATALQRARPALTWDELDRLSQRLEHVNRHGRSKGVLAVLCVAFGFLFTTAGTGLAVSGFGEARPAVQSQYPDEPSSQPGSSGHAAHGGGVLGAERPGPPANDRQSVESLQRAARANSPQESATGLLEAQSRTSLPFTGFAAIPVLGVGLALLASGAVIRLRSRWD